MPDTLRYLNVYDRFKEFERFLDFYRPGTNNLRTIVFGKVYKIKCWQIQKSQRHSYRAK